MLPSTITALRKTIVDEFCAVTEFQAFTVLAYHEAANNASRTDVRLKKMTLTYSDFASKLGIEDLVFKPEEVPKQYTDARDNYLFALILQQQIGLFEHYFFEIVRLLLTDNPKRLAADKKIDYRSVIASDSLEGLISSIVEREINSLKYKKPSEWFAFLESLVSKCTVESTKIEAVTKAKAARDILVHNRGIVNETYIEKADAFGKYDLGSEIKLSGEEVRDIWVNLLSVLLELIDKLLAVFQGNKSCA